MIVSRSEVEKEDVVFEFRRSKKAKKIRITVHFDGRVVLTVPTKVPKFIAQSFLKRKESWIASKIDAFRKMNGGVRSKYGKADFLKHKKLAQAFAEERVKYFSDLYGVSFSKVSIKDQKTRWGSCSKRGNLNFNYKIVLLPKELAEYIIVHEVCHLKQLNHSRKFWEMVARTIPQHKQLRKDLRKIGVSFY